MNGSNDVSLLAAAAIAVAAPLVGAACSASGVHRGRPRVSAVTAAVVSLSASLAITLLWSRGDGTPAAFGDRLGGGAVVFIDGITAVLLPYVALVELVILLVAPRRALEQSAVTRLLVGSAATCAVFLTTHPLLLITLWCVTALLTWVSVRGTPGGSAAARVFAIAMATAVLCMAVGTVLLVVDPPWTTAAGWAGTAGGWLVAVAVMIRKGIFPFHSWYPRFSPARRCRPHSRRRCRRWLPTRPSACSSATSITPKAWRPNWSCSRRWRS